MSKPVGVGSGDLSELAVMAEQGTQGSIAKMLVQTIGMFYGFRKRPYLSGFGEIGPRRKEPKDELRNGTAQSAKQALGGRPAHAAAV